MVGSTQRVERRLAAILAADVAGFSALMGQDEEGTLTQVKALQREILEPEINRHRGRLVKTTGDGFLVEFGSPIEAVRCALAIQQVLASSPLKLRIGINLGDILLDDGDIYGDGVNIAARLEQLAEPGGLCISGKVYDEVEGKLDTLFENRGEQTVKNIIRPVRVYAHSGAALTPPPSTARSKPLAAPAKPSVAVLPFTNMSGDPEQEYFCDGLVEDIITALSRIKALFVIARNSSFIYKGRAIDVRQVGRELGVRYVLEGSVRKAGQRIRITGQLIEAETGAHVWADRYDGGLEDIFDLQDRITASIAGTLEPRLLAAEVERATRKRPDDLTAYDHHLRASVHAHTLTPEGMASALVELRRALEIDPQYAPAHALAAWCYLWPRANSWPQAPGDDQIGLKHANQAVMLDPDDPTVLWTAAMVMSILNREHERALDLTSRSVALNPSSSMAWAVRGWAFCFLGLGDEAIECFERAERLSPLDPLTWFFHAGIGSGHLHERRYEETIHWWERALRENPGFVGGFRSLAAAYAYLGRLEDARAFVAQILEKSPDMTISKWAVQGPQKGPSRDHLLEGLRRAGLPE